MSNPVLFFILIIVIDLILKSVKDKKKIEKDRQQRKESPNNRTELSREKPIQKSQPIRDIMSTLREEIENEKHKELIKRQENTKQNQYTNLLGDEQTLAKKKYEADEYWNNKRKIEEDIKLQEKSDLEKNKTKRDIKDVLVSGIIFSEILSEPKSIKNQRRGM